MGGKGEEKQRNRVTMTIGVTRFTTKDYILGSSESCLLLPPTRLGELAQVRFSLSNPLWNENAEPLLIGREETFIGLPLMSRRLQHNTCGCSLLAEQTQMEKVEKVENVGGGSVQTC